jgi:ubiquinone/menaquinone biosynthesis C-methylase UbiE
MKMTAIEKRFVNAAARKQAVAREVTALTRRFEIAQGARVLDVGCGVGSATRALAERGDIEVVGVDVDPAQIAAAQADGPRENLRFLVMDATALDFPDGQFDVVVTSMATHHIPHWQRAVAEMARVTRPGGHLVYIDFMFRTGWRGQDVS